MTIPNNRDTWTACKPGELTALSASAKRRAQRQTVLTFAGATAITAASVLLLVNYLQVASVSTSPWGKSGTRPAVATRMSCDDTLEFRDKYLLGQLDDNTRDLVRAHISHCPHCTTGFGERAKELDVDFIVVVTPPANLFAYDF